MKRINLWMLYLYTAYIAYLEFYSSIICGNETKLMQKTPNIMFLIYPNNIQLESWNLSEMFCSRLTGWEMTLFQYHMYPI